MICIEVTMMFSIYFSILVTVYLGITYMYPKLIIMLENRRSRLRLKIKSKELEEAMDVYFDSTDVLTESANGRMVTPNAISLQELLVEFEEEIL